jgi:hypothetical protein
MKKPSFLNSRFLLFFFLFNGINAYGQEMTANSLLEKSIAYHDPQGVWAAFNGTFTVQMDSPDRPLRTSEITIHLPNAYFKSVVRQGDTVILSEMEQGVCTYMFNGSPNYSQEIAEKHRLNCERTTTMRNYYTYLYGLPMKLKDPGTLLHPTVERVSFNEETFLRLRVDYEEGVGTDRWYFYFDTNTFQLRHYQFYHDEEANDGEYILMEDEIVVAGIKMPKTRAWYTNKEKKYLGTDRLLER